MEKTENKNYRLQVIQFLAYLVSLIVAVLLAWGSMDTRVSIIEIKMDNKVDKQELFQKMDDMRVKIEQKIENEVSKIKR